MTVVTVSFGAARSEQTNDVNTSNIVDIKNPNPITKEDKKPSSLDVTIPLESKSQLDLTNQVIFYVLLTTSTSSFVLLVISYLALIKQKTKLDNMEEKMKVALQELADTKRAVTQQGANFVATDIPSAKRAVYSSSDSITAIPESKSKNKSHIETDDIKLRVSPEQPQLSYDPNDIISVYNYDAKLLRDSVTEVISESKQSIQGRMLDNSQPLLLQKDSKGDYWVVRVKQERYVLFPKANFKLNQFNIETLIGLFELQNYYQGAYRFQLLKPAQIIPSHGSKYWQVEALGILKFT